VLVQGTLSVSDGHRIAHAVKDQVRAELASIADVLVHIEPFDEQKRAPTPAPLDAP
jgi:divalent metal cation (Fe/Co/Zn/Cd) transporter